MPNIFNHNFIIKRTPPPNFFDKKTRPKAITTLLYIYRINNQYEHPFDKIIIC